MINNLYVIIDSEILDKQYLKVFEENKNSNRENFDKEDELSQNIEKKRIKDDLINEHPILNIFYVYNPIMPRIIRATLQFLHILGKMYFIGLFYEGKKSIWFWITGYD